jgi:hypothetical protein
MKHNSLAASRMAGLVVVLAPLMFAQLVGCVHDAELRTWTDSYDISAPDCHIWTY